MGRNTYVGKDQLVKGLGVDPSGLNWETIRSEERNGKTYYWQRAEYEVGGEKKELYRTDFLMVGRSGSGQKQAVQAGYWYFDSPEDIRRHRTRWAMFAMTGMLAMQGPTMAAVAQTAIAAGSANEGLRAIRISPRFRPLTDGGAQQLIRFGQNENQIYHAFRHTDSLGLERVVVQKVIEGDVQTVASQLPVGQVVNRVVAVAGQRIQYTAYKLEQGLINIGRIHAAP